MGFDRRPDNRAPALPVDAGIRPIADTSGPDEEDQGGCPPPLSWRQVLKLFREQSRPWVLRRGNDELRGRTWGEGPPLYLLNGLGGTCELFALVLWLLRNDFRCVVYDYPAGTAKGGVLTAAGLADDLFAVADLHGDRRFPIYAASFGSVVGLTAMLRNRDRVGRAILQTGFAYRRLSVAERFLIRLGRHMPGQVRRMPFAHVLRAHNHRPWFPPFDRSRWEFFIENTGGVPVSALANRAAVLRDFDVRDRLDEIEQPVLLFQSEGDGRVAEACHRVLESGLANARSERLTGCGQIPYLTHPHRVAKLVRSYLNTDEQPVHASAGCPSPQEC